MPMPQLSDTSPAWLVKTLQEHSPVHGWCSCTYKNPEGSKRKYILFSAEHQADEVHKVLSEAVLSLVNGEKK